MSYHYSSMSRQQHYGEPEPVDPSGDSGWPAPVGNGRHFRRRQGPGIPPVPLIFFGIIGLLFFGKFILGLAGALLVVPLMVVFVPIVIIMSIFWPVVIFGGIGWLISRIIRAINGQPSGHHRTMPRHGAPKHIGHGPWGYQRRSTQRVNWNPQRVAPYGEPVGSPVAQQAAARPTPAAPEVLHSNPEVAALLSRGWGYLDQSRAAIRRFPDIVVRRRASAVVDQAEHIMDAFREGRGDSVLASKFVDRYLAPTTTILERYARVANRGVESAQPVLDRVVEHDLPMIEKRFQELYERLHRGDLIDLEVASEMLAFDLDEASGSSGEKTL